MATQLFFWLCSPPKIGGRFIPTQFDFFAYFSEMVGWWVQPPTRFPARFPDAPFNQSAILRSCSTDHPVMSDAGDVRFLRLKAMQKPSPNNLKTENTRDHRFQKGIYFLGSISRLLNFRGFRWEKLQILGQVFMNLDKESV